MRRHQNTQTNGTDFTREISVFTHVYTKSYTENTQYLTYLQQSHKDGNGTTQSILKHQTSIVNEQEHLFFWNEMNFFSDCKERLWLTPRPVGENVNMHVYQNQSSKMHWSSLHSLRFNFIAVGSIYILILHYFKMENNYLNIQDLLKKW